MPSSSRNNNPQLRQQLAHIAAHLLINDPTLGSERARRKAAARVGAVNSRNWPSTAEVLAALAQEQRLFCPSQPVALRTLRTQALAAMRHFTHFQPRLVGQVLEGTADHKSCVCLHLFADNSDDVILALLESSIPYQQRNRLLHYADGTYYNHPALRFVAGEVDIELIVLPIRACRNPPLSPICGHPERGVDIQQLERLLETNHRLNPSSDPLNPIWTVDT